MVTERPNRSDEHLSVEEETKIEEEARSYFNGIAPKRHTKPQRSEPSAQYVDGFPNGGPLPEYVEFRRLEKDDHQKIIRNERSDAAGEEFVETEYYSSLNCINKQHHTTGTGFIKTDLEKCNGFLPSELSFGVEPHGSCKGNPATNDWIPSMPYEVDYVSDKPKRSEN